MRGVILGLRPPSGRWSERLHRRYPLVRLRIESIVPISADRSIEVVSLRGPRVELAVREVEGSPSVERVMRLDRARDRQRIRVDVVRCPLAALIRRTGLIPRVPLEVDAHGERWFVPADRELVLSALGESGLDGFQIVEDDVRGLPGPHADLTARQEEILEHAIAQGYYAYPRRTTLTLLADRIGISKSTLSESLMVIENKVMRAHIGHRQDRMMTTP